MHLDYEFFILDFEFGRSKISIFSLYAEGPDDKGILQINHSSKVLTELLKLTKFNTKSLIIASNCNK